MNAPFNPLAVGDELRGRLLTLGNRLKPVNDDTYFFFEIVRELVDAALSSYDRARQAYVDSAYDVLAWGCRNLLELAIFTRYVLISSANARRFSDDRLIDGCEILTALKSLELHYDPQAVTTSLDERMAAMKAQMAVENVTASSHLRAGELARLTGLNEEFVSMNRVSSKLVHPTAWSVLAMNSGTNSFSDSRDILFFAAAQYLGLLLVAVKEHNAMHGMFPNP